MDFFEKLNRLPGKEKNNLYGKNILHTCEMTDSEIKAVANTAKILKDLRDSNVSTKVFDTGIAVSMFSKKDLSMELAFASGCDLLGLSIVEMEKRLESSAIKENAAMASYTSDALGVCDSDFIEKSSRYIKRIADSVEESHKNKILSQKPCVLNLGSDEDSPVQILADLQYMADRFGGLENLKGKKIAVTWAYSPNGTASLAVPNGLVLLAARFGMDVVLASPKGMDLMPGTYQNALKNAEASGGSFKNTDSMEEAFAGADVVAPVNWAPYAFLEKRTELSYANLGSQIDLLEHELRENNKAFANWEATEEMMEKTREGKALLLHSLPADVTDISCIRGEMTAQVYNANLTDLLAEAGMRPYVIAAMILLSKSEDPKNTLKIIAEKAEKRYF